MHEIKVVDEWLTFFVVGNSFESALQAQLLDYVLTEVEIRV
jgi:hypothetical protein